eukprot:IDg646t1
MAYCTGTRCFCPSGQEHFCRQVLSCAQETMVGRGGSYASDEDTALARCWVATSENHDEQNAAKFWGTVEIAFHQQPEFEQSRTAESLRSRWGTLQRSVQKYLAAERLYLSKPVSGETHDDVCANIMRLYRSRTAKVDKN